MIIQKATLNLARIQPPAAGMGSLASYKLEKYRSLSSADPRHRRGMSTTSANSPLQRTRSLSARGAPRHDQMVAPTDKLRRKHASKEMVRRALTPPARRMNLRWLNFRPTPSRLSNMSMAVPS